MTTSTLLTIPTVLPHDDDSPATKGGKTAKNQDISMTKPDINRTNEDKISIPSTLKCREMSPFVVDSGPACLSRRQIQALPYLVSCPTLAEAARHAQVTLRTLQRWLKNPDFREEYEGLRKAANEIARAELNGLSLKAAVVLGESLDDPNSSIRLRAALAALAMSQKSNEIHELSQQLDLISAALPLWAVRKSGAS